jgi:hypothetical protein
MSTTAEALVTTEAASFVRAPRSLTEDRPATAIARPTLPRPPHPIPTFVTMANALARNGTAWDMWVIWGKYEEEYFSDRDWTDRNRLIRFRKLGIGRNALWEAL